MNIKSSQTLVSEALKQIKTISTNDAYKMVETLEKALGQQIQQSQDN